MSVTFNSADVAELEAAFEALLSPVGGSDAEWHARVSEAVRRACQADKVLLALPHDPFVPFFSQRHDARMLRDYAEHYYKVDPGNERIAARGLQVYNQRMVVAHEVETFLHSEIYADLFVPYRIRDCLGMSFAPDPARRRRGDSIAMLTLHSETAENESFAERGLTLLRLLRPAFCAGVAGRIRLASLGPDFSGGLERVGDGIRVVDAEGEIVYENPSLGRTLTATPRRAELDAAIAKTAAAVIRPSPLATDPVTGAHAGAASEVLHSGGTTYRIHGVRVQPGMLGAPDGRPYAMVDIRENEPRAPILSWARTTFGLTTRESQVAWLLAKGETNKGIATRLNISPNTARHHTERVLAKLGVGARAKVASLLLLQPS